MFNLPLPFSNKIRKEIDGSTQMLLEKMANLLKTTAFCLYLANSLTTF
jgi:hypothetical protein